MTRNIPNIVLIGMPGAGKSTIGVLLAKATARDFVDTDLLIQSREERPLQHIVDTHGHMVLRDIEESVLLDLHVHGHVIATGGSAAYSHAAMMHLKRNGIIVFLDVDLATLESRIHDYATRGLAKRPEQSFAELFAEREALYRKYADITVECSGLNQDEICDRIVAALNRVEARAEAR